MTVSTSNNSVVYRGNGSATTFPVPFKVDDEDLLVVTRRVYETGAEDHVYIGTDYSYSGIGDSSGTLTLAGTALDDDYELVIERIVPYTQDLDIVNAGGFYPESVERQLDLIVMGIQQLAAEVGRAVRMAPGNNLDVLAGGQANTVVGFNNEGELELLGSASFQGNPGGNAMAVGPFTTLSTLSIPAGYNLIRTSEYSVGAGYGGAFYIADDTVDEAYAATHSTLTAVSADGQGWRIAEPVIDITQAGILPGDSGALATANSAKVVSLLTYLIANELNTTLSGTAVIKVTAPSGHFRFTDLWEVKCALWLQGQSNSLAHGYATHFDFDEAGFEFHSPATSHAGLVSPATTGASGFKLESIYCSSRAATGTGFHGLYAVTRGEVSHCTFAIFPGDGIRFESETVFGAANNNANSSRILSCLCEGNGGNGIHLLNGDTNCVTTDSCSLNYNGGFGLFDNAFLSNNHRNHHTEGNGLGQVFDHHKISDVSSVCYYPITAWASGVAIAVSAEGLFRYNAGKLYRLLIAGVGNTANAPTHTTEAGVLEADGYKWAYEGTGGFRRYHVALQETVAASTTTPGSDSTVWVPFAFDEIGGDPGIPLWETGMTWKEGGSYCGATTAGETVWVAGYEELGQAPAQIRSPALWLGGQSLISPWSNCGRNKVVDGAISNPRGFIASRPFYDGNELRALFGTNLTFGHVLTLAHESLHPNSFYMVGGRDTYMLLDGQASNYITFTGPLTEFTGGKSTSQPGVVNIPRFYLGVGANARQIDYDTAAPVGGSHARGDIVYNVAPTAGGFVGWVCTSAGTPGTWKTFGAISA